MVKPVNDHDHPDLGVDYDPGAEPDTPLSDDALLDLLDALVGEQGRVPTARVLRVNYRTLSNCFDFRQVSRRMRRALVEFRDAGGDGGGEARNGVDGASLAANVDALRQRAAEQENENAELRSLADEQARQLEEVTYRLAALEGTEQSGDAAGGVDIDSDSVADDANSHEQGDRVGQVSRPPLCQLGMPDARVVILEEQPHEALTFGPAAPLAAEWRQFRTEGGRSVSRVDRAQAAIRRWELEARMLGKYHLTLPTETFLLDEERSRDDVR